MKTNLITAIISLPFRSLSESSEPVFNQPEGSGLSGRTRQSEEREPTNRFVIKEKQPSIA